MDHEGQEQACDLCSPTGTVSFGNLWCFVCVSSIVSFWEIINFINIHKNVNFVLLFWSDFYSSEFWTCFYNFSSTYVDISCTSWQEWKKVCLFLPSHQYRKCIFLNGQKSVQYHNNQKLLLKATISHH